MNELRSLSFKIKIIRYYVLMARIFHLSYISIQNNNKQNNNNLKA